MYLLKQNKVIVLDEISESYPGKNIYRKDSKFSATSTGQTVQIEISLLLRNQYYEQVQAGNCLIFRVFFNFNGVSPENETVIFFFFFFFVGGGGGGGRVSIFL